MRIVEFVAFEKSYLLTNSEAGDVALGVYGSVYLTVWPLLRMNRLQRARRLMSFDSNCLQDYGWYVEVDGQRVASLSLMRWHSEGFDYTIRPLTCNSVLANAIVDQRFWDENVELFGTKIVLRSRLTEEAVPGIWRHGGFVRDAHGRTWVCMLALSLPTPRKTIVDRWLLWLKRRKLAAIKQRIMQSRD